MCKINAHYASFLFYIALSQNVFADTENNLAEDNLCPVANTTSQHTRPREFSSEHIGNTEISADFSESSTDGSSSLGGNVIIEQHLLRITADHAHYDKPKNILTFSGNVHIDSEAMSLEADAGTVNIDTEEGQTRQQGEFKNIKFFIADSNMKGQAETIHSGSNSQSTLNNAKITSCDLLDPDWLISADEIELDHKDEYGSADDVVMRFKGVPFLYTPYIEFPTSDKRRSGLLFPEIGTSSSRGVELAAPWYWNIAPNQDAVLTPRYMERRGFELGGDYRYLTRSTIGELKGAYLPEDSVTEEKRYSYRYTQNTNIMPNLLLDILYQDISDSDYFNDFSNSLVSTSQTHLNRDARLRYDLNDWHMQALIQDIETINTLTPIADRPYVRLPQLTLNGDTKISSSPVFFSFDSEFVDFEHEDETKTTGTRITIRPGLRLPLSGAAWFFNPEVKFSHTQYNVGTESTDQTVDNLNLPISSIDSGLFFERNLDNGYQQTLEPRLYYLNVPFEDQNNIPLFDTSIPAFSVSQLFRDNRFVGGDRIGDTNQLTLALTSRILNPNTGNELLRASIGQIYYFEDRKVTLDSSTGIDTSSQSDIIAELDTMLGYWKSNIDLQWNTTNHELSQENYFLHYKSDDLHIFNIGYRKRLDNNSALDIEQTDTSFVYAINKNYSSVVRWNYSLKDRKSIDTIAGLAYDSCCWSIQLLAQRRLKNTTVTTIVTDEPYDDAILVQFVFKGLGSISGSKARNTLEESIYGYRDSLQ